MLHLIIRPRPGSDDIVADLIPICLQHLERRGESRVWRISNEDVVLKPGSLLTEFASFIEGPMTWDRLKEALNRTDSISEISLYSPKLDMSESAAQTLIEQRRWEFFNSCLDLFDSSELVFFSDEKRDISQLSSLLVAEHPDFIVEECLGGARPH